MPMVASQSVIGRSSSACGGGAIERPSIRMNAGRSADAWPVAVVLAALLTSLLLLVGGCSSLGKGSGEPAASAAAVPTAVATPSTTAPPIASSRRVIRALCVNCQNAFLRAALLDDYFEVVNVTPAEYPVPRGAFDVTIFDRVAPEAPPGSGPSLYIRPSGPSSPLVASPAPLRGGDDALGFDTTTKASPLLRWMVGLENVNIVEATGVVPRTEDRVIGASTRGPLLVSGSRGDRRFVALTFDLVDSDLPMRTAWPILFANAIGDLVGKDVYSLRAIPDGPPPGESSAPIEDVAGVHGPPNRDVIKQAGQHGFAGRDYRRTYGEYRALVRDELERGAWQEPVRYYVERYFDAIRPKD